jgi:putative transposase
MDVTNSDGMVLRVHEFRSDEFQARHEEQADRKRHMFHNATRYCQRPNCDFYELQ